MRRGRPRKKSESKSYNPVSVIKTRKELEALQNATSNLRDIAYISLALNTGYRSSDLLALKVGDVLAGTTTSRIQIVKTLGRREQKTGWGSIRELGAKPRAALHKYLLSRQPVDRDEPLFISRQRDREGNKKPLSLDRVNLILTDLSVTAGINKRIRSHSLRKAFGYFVYQKSRDITQVQALFGHSSGDITLRYIGIVQEELGFLTSNLDL